MTIFDSNNFDFDSIISYKQWVSTDRTTSATTVNEFIDILTDKNFSFVITTSYRCYRQEKKSKALWNNETYTILMYFEKNQFSCPRCNTKLLLAESTSHTPSLYSVHNDDDSKLKCDCYCVI